MRRKGRGEIVALNAIKVNKGSTGGGGIVPFIPKLVFRWR